MSVEGVGGPSENEVNDTESHPEEQGSEDLENNNQELKRIADIVVSQLARAKEEGKKEHSFITSLPLWLDLSRKEGEQTFDFQRRLSSSLSEISHFLQQVGHEIGANELTVHDDIDAGRTSVTGKIGGHAIELGAGRYREGSSFVGRITDIGEK